MGVQIPKNNGKQEIRKWNNEIAGSLSLRKIFQESIFKKRWGTKMKYYSILEKLFKVQMKS